MDSPLSESQLAEIKSMVFAGNKIAAIKLYRQHTSLGLAESKTAIDQMEVELRVSSPEQFAKPANKGCLGMVMIGAGIAGAVGWLLR